MNASLADKPENVDLNAVSVSALNISSRMKLAWMLNPEQSLCSTSGIARDYRGLAELMQFEWNDIKNFQRSDDPTMKLLESWSTNSSNTIGMLKKYLEEMERYDIIEDCMAQFKRDASVYLSRKNYQNPIQVPEVTSCKSVSFQIENSSALTISDAHSGTCTFYDAYVCYADEDLPFVWQLAEFLESDAVKLKLFIKDRDLLAGASEPDAHVFLIQERCSCMLIILSPEFLLSPACEFQTSFAAGLAMERRRRKLIPIIIKPCNIPNILKYVSKIDFTKPVVPAWLWDKVIQSIKGTSTSVFVSSPSVGFQRSSHSRRIHVENEPQHSLSPVITFPASGQYSVLPTNSNVIDFPLSSTPTSFHSISIAAPPVEKITPPSTKKILHKLKNRFISSNLSSTSAQPSSLNTSSLISETSTSFALHKEDT